MIIYIKNLHVRTIVGIYDWERKTQQDVIINVAMQVGNEVSAQSDKVEDTVNYKLVCKAIIGHVEGRTFDLIEKIAGDVSDIVLAYEGVSGVEVEVDKPGALRFADSVSVRLEKYSDA